MIISQLKTNDKDKLRDITWTPMGNIVYTTYSNEVGVISSAGKVIAKHTQFKTPRYLRVSYEDIIYLADYEAGVYQSINDGVSWNFVFNSTDGWHCLQAIKKRVRFNESFI